MKAIIGTADHSSLNWLSQLEQHFLIQVSSTGDQLFEAVESGYFLQQPPELVVLAFLPKDLVTPLGQWTRNWSGVGSSL